MIALLLMVSAPFQVPYEPHIDCADPGTGNRPMVIVVITKETGILWNHQPISRKEFDLRVDQEHSQKPAERDVFRVVRDSKSAAEAEELVQELSKSQIPFGKNCLPAY